MGREQKGQKAREAEETKGAAEKEGKRAVKRKTKSPVLAFANKFLVDFCHFL